MKIILFSLFMMSSVSFASLKYCKIATAKPGSVFAPYIGGEIILNFDNGQVLLSQGNFLFPLNLGPKISSFNVDRKFCKFQSENESEDQSAMYSCTEKREGSRDLLLTIWMTYDAKKREGGYQEVYFDGNEETDPYLLFDSCL